METRTGSCHCGAVRFEVDLDGPIRATECNCSICQRAGYLHVIVDRSAFRLLQGGDRLRTYTFNTRVAQHRFCSCCGVKSFYVPRSHPDGISVNGRCLELSPGERAQIAVRPFDGANWEANVRELARLEGGSEAEPR